MSKSNKKDSRKYASVKSRGINKLLFPKKKYRYLFPNKESAIKQLNWFRSMYIFTSRISEEEEMPKDQLKIWIRGLRNPNATESRKALPKGEFINVTIAEIEDKKYVTYSYEILDIDPKFHPQRGPIIKGNPNWGFPILRDFKKGKIYHSLEKPISEFDRLEKYFPKSTQRGDATTLYLIVAERLEGEMNYTKYIFSIVENAENEFKVNIKLNKFQGKIFVRQKFNIYSINLFSLMHPR